MVHAIAALPLARQDAQWLRCSALAYLTRDPDWFTQQAALADESISADAAMTLLGLAWHHALVRTAGHEAFVQLLRAITAPRLQRLLAVRMPDTGPVRDNKHGTRLKVAIYTPEVGNNRHGSTALTLNTMSVLALQDVDVHGYSAKEMSIPAIGSYHGGAEALTPLAVNVASLKMHTPGNIQFSFPNADLSLRSRFVQVLQAIDAYAPDVVVFVGFMSPLVYRLYAHYPVVGLSVHSVPPVAPVDVWLSADPQIDAACWPGIPAPQVFAFPFRFWPTGQAQPVERTSIGLPAHSIVLVTAGFRLPSEISTSWGEAMRAFIEARPNVHWLLVGIVEGQSTASLPAHPRIHLFAPQPQLEA